MLDLNILSEKLVSFIFSYLNINEIVNNFALNILNYTNSQFQIYPVLNYFYYFQYYIKKAQINFDL